MIQQFRDQQVCELRHEVTMLRKKLHTTGEHGRRVNQAYADALVLAQWHCTYIPTSRSYAKYKGISQREWQNAHGLLRMVGVLDRHRHWTSRDLVYIEERLELAFSRAIERPNEYKAWLNRHANNE